MREGGRCNAENIPQKPEMKDILIKYPLTYIAHAVAPYTMEIGSQVATAQQHRSVREQQPPSFALREDDEGRGNSGTAGKFGILGLIAVADDRAQSKYVIADGGT